MKKIKGYWVDTRGNQWAGSITTAKQAQQYSETLIDCYNCRNCHNCENCKNIDNCRKCVHCYTCQHCTECYHCIGCNNAKNCRYSRRCTYMNKCSNCHDCCECYECDYCRNCEECTTCCNCKNCNNCNHISHCHDYRYQPREYRVRIVTVMDIVSTIIFYYGKINEVPDYDMQIVYGSFRGNMAQFEAFIHDIYQHDERQYQQYINEITKVRLLFDI